MASYLKYGNARIFLLILLSLSAFGSCAFNCIYTPCGVCCGLCQAFRRPVYTSARTFSEMVCVSNHRFQRNGEWRVLRFTLRPQSNLLIRWEHNLLPSNFPSWEWSPVLELHQNPLWPGDREARTRLALPKKKEVRPILRPPRSRAKEEENLLFYT